MSNCQDNSNEDISDANDYSENKESNRDDVKKKKTYEQEAWN